MYPGHVATQNARYTYESRLPERRLSDCRTDDDDDDDDDEDSDDDEYRYYI